MKQEEKNLRTLRKFFKNHHDYFNKIKEWTDVSNWLQKTAKYLE